MGTTKSKKEELYPGYNKDLQNAFININSDNNWDKYIESFKKYNYNIHHPNFPIKDKEYIIELINKYPKVSFYEYCLLTYFQTIKEVSISNDINPKEDKDVLIGNNNILDKINEH